MNFKDIYKSAKKYVKILGASALVASWVAGNIYGIRQEKIDTENAKYVATWINSDAPIYAEKRMGFDKDGDGNIEEIKILAIGIAGRNGVFMGEQGKLIPEDGNQFIKTLDWLIANNTKE